MKLKIKKWKPYLLICLVAILISCNENRNNKTKQGSGADTSKKKITSHVNEIAQNTAHSKKDLTKSKSKSFVISCGGGCAMTYNVKNIDQTSSTLIKVTFEVDTYIDEEPSETFDETYIFSYNNDHQIEKITRENERENVLDNLIGAAQQTFKDFAAELIN